MNELIKLVEQWSKDKGLDQTGSSKQALKFFEEAGEVSAALARNNKADLLVESVLPALLTLGEGLHFLAIELTSFFGFK